MSTQELLFFKEQIGEDIALIQSRWAYMDAKLIKPEYAFNYWILSRIYSIDEDLIPDYITEYNDRGWSAPDYCAKTKVRRCRQSA